MTISAIDFNSLTNLAIIQAGQMVDVGNGGQVCVPYHNNFGASVWKNVNFLGSSSNYEDLIPLFERTFFSMYMRQGYLSAYVRSSLMGLNLLKMTLHENPEALNHLCRVSEFVEEKLSEWESRPQHCQSLKPSAGDAIYTDLEKSVFMHRLNPNPNITLTTATGIDWVIRKIDAFTQAAAGICPQDRLVLDQINAALRKSTEWDKVRQMWDDPQLQNKTIGEIKILIAHAIDDYIHSLEQSPMQVRENVGIVIPFSFGFTKWDHVVTFGLCQNKDGAFFLSQANAGLGAHAEKYSFGLNYNCPLTPYGKTVVEYGPLDRATVTEFLIQLQKTSIQTQASELAAEAYQKLLQPLQAHLSPRQIPSRRLQVSGNCTNKSPLEWALFCLQKYGKVELANHLLQVSPKRDPAYSPSFEPVESLPSIT